MASEATNWMCETMYHQTGHRLRTIIDGTACVGGDTISFALDRQIEHVIAIEISTARYECLLNNLALYPHLIASKVFAVNQNFLIWLDEMKSQLIENGASAVFLDPPWGGSEYKNRSIIDELYLERTHSCGGGGSVERVGMVDLAKHLLQIFPMVVLKLPAANYRFENFHVFKRVAKFTKKKCTFVALFDNITAE